MSTRPVFDSQIQAKVTACGVIAVLVIDEVRDAVPLARALLAGGVTAMELTPDRRREETPPVFPSIMKPLPGQFPTN